MCVVFTFCDGINPNKRLKKNERLFNREYASEWFNEHVRKDDEGNVFEGIPELPQERFFLFNGEEGLSGPETTTAELNEFIHSCMPEQPEQATTIQHFNYAAYLETAKNSCNKDLQQVANEEIDALKKQLEDAAEVEAQMRERIEQAQNAGNDEEVEQIEQEMQGRRGNN